MRIYQEVCEKQFADLYDVAKLGDPDINQKNKAEIFVDSLFALNQEFNIPKTFEKLHYDDFDSIIDIAFKEAHGTYPVPLYLSKNQAIELLKLVSDN